MACCDIRFNLDFTTECFADSAKHYIVVNFMHQETERRAYFQTDGVTPIYNVDFILMRVTKPNVSSDKLSSFFISEWITNTSPIPGLIKRIPANYYTELPNKLIFRIYPACALSSSERTLADAVFTFPDYTVMFSDGTYVEYKFFTSFPSIAYSSFKSTSGIMPIVLSSDMGPIPMEIQKMYGSNSLITASESACSFAYKQIENEPSFGICRCDKVDSIIYFPHGVPDGLSLSLCTYDIESMKGFRLVQGPYNYGEYSNTRRNSCSDCIGFSLVDFTVPVLSDTATSIDYLYLFFQPCANITLALDANFQTTTGAKVEKVEASIIPLTPPYSELYLAYRPFSIRISPAAANSNTNTFLLSNIFASGTTHASFLIGSMSVWIVTVDKATGNVTYRPYTGTIQYAYDPILAAPYASVLTPNGL